MESNGQPDMIRWTDFITKVGFPIAAASYLLWVLTVFVNDVQKDVRAVSQALLDHSQVTTQNASTSKNIELVLIRICVNISRNQSERDRCLQ